MFETGSPGWTLTCCEVENDLELLILQYPCAEVSGVQTFVLYKFDDLGDLLQCWKADPRTHTAQSHLAMLWLHPALALQALLQPEFLLSGNPNLFNHLAGNDTDNSKYLSQTPNSEIPNTS